MTLERSLKIVRGHRPQRVPPSAEEAGLTATAALVLSTFRSDSPDMVLDHPLWLACMESVSALVRADRTEVLAEPERRLLAGLRPRPQRRPLGSLESYGARLLSDSSTPDWEFVVWKRAEGVVAVAVCERWYLVGGPPRYHDSYTTCLFVDSATLAELVQTLELRARQEGAWIEEVVDASQERADSKTMVSGRSE
jgi:hypothetical protein